jgi:PKD repeat protein
MKALKHPLLWIVISMLFSIHNKAQTDRYLVGYQTSFNGSDAVSFVPIAPVQHLNLSTLVDASSLTNAYNILQLRFKDDQGYWSSIVSQPIIKVPAGTLDEKKLIAYEYMFNQGENVHYVPISPQNDVILVAELDASGLSNTLNLLNIRFQDDSGMWSSYVSQFVVVIPDGDSANKNIVAYEYAFNDGEFVAEVPLSPQMDYVLITEITTSELTNSLNTFHIRFKDESGMYSSYVTQFYLYQPPTPDALDNKLASYAYWFATDGSEKREMDLNPDMPHLSLEEIDVQDLWEGDYTLHTQYKDVLGRHSMVTSDNFHKNLHPLALFNVDANAICEGESVLFINDNSVDFDTVLYDFGDGQTSTELDISHTYANFGTYTATMTVTDTESGMFNTATKTINVYKIPDNTIYTTDEIPACFGTSVTIRANETSMQYEWSNGSTEDHIEVTQGGNYSVIITNPSHTTCSVTSDEIIVSFKPEIDDTILIQDYPLLLTANESAATYQWIDCTNGNIDIEGATGVSYEPTVNGDYALEVTKYGCTVTSDCITISTVDVADYGIKEIVQMFPNPSDEFVYISCEIPIQVIVYSSNGSILATQSYEIGVQTLDVKQLQSGLYFTKITALSGEWENQSTLIKLIIE